MHKINHGNYIVDHEKAWKNHGIVFLNFCGNPVLANGHHFVQELSPMKGILSL